MPFFMVRNDISRMPTDAIVNAAKPSLLGGGGVDGAIHAAAGPQLLKECRTLGGCRPGEAKLTGGYRLPCRYVIHTVGPVWQGGGAGEEETLRACYRNSLRLAEERGCESISFPLISAGHHGYPPGDTIRLAREEIVSFLEHSEMRVYLVLYGRDSLELGHALAAGIEEYIDDNYVESRRSLFRRANRAGRLDDAQVFASSEELLREDGAWEPGGLASVPIQTPAPAVSAGSQQAMESSLQDRLSRLDESFQQMLLRKIDERGISDTACYKRANIDRKLFSKIRGDVNYRPKKQTAIAFAIALELDIGETEELLEKAGYALSNSYKFDVIVRYFIERKQYDIFDINEALFYHDQRLLGA